MITLLLSLIGIAVYFLVKHYNAKMRPIFEKSEKIPGPKTVPLIGNALQFGTNTKEFFDYTLGIQNKYGPIFRAWIGPFLGVLLADAKYIEVILGSNKLVEKAYLYKFAQPWLGEGMLTNKGAVWKRHRKIIMPAFQMRIIDKFVNIYNKHTDIMLQQLEKRVGGPEFDVFPYFNLLALDIICETSMGVNINAQLDSTSKYVEAVTQLGSAMFIRAFKPWLHPEVIFKYSKYGQIQKRCIKVLKDMSSNIIKIRKKLLNEENESEEMNQIKEEDNLEDVGMKQRYAFLDMMLQAVKDGESLTDLEIQEEVDTVMLAGHDTTTSALSFTTYVLATHPDIQERVMQELDEIFGDSDRAPTTRDIQDMKYLEMVIKESLRLYPSVPIFGRLITEDVPIGDGYVLPAGTNVGFNPYTLHRDPKHFPDPEKFDPDRFLPENSIGRHPYCYIPFSGGPRICLGMKFAMMEMKAVLSGLLRRYRLVPAPPSYKLDLTIVLILKSVTGVCVRLENRT